MTRFVVILALLAALTSSVRASDATFVAKSGGSATRFAAATDWVAPTIARAVVVATSSGTAGTATPGFLRPGATFRVYASVTDPNAGVAAATADLSSLAGAGVASAPLTAGTFTVAGVTYTHASAELTAVASLPDGTRSFAVSARDHASNAGAASFSATVDGTAPAATDVQSANLTGGTGGRPEQGDVLTFTLSEPVATASVLPDWFGGTTTVTVRILNGTQNDSVHVFNAANTTRSALGSIDTGKKYVTADVAFPGSTMTLSGSTVTVVLGAASNPSALPAVPPNTTSTLGWTPGAGLTDRAGNAVPATPVLELGTLDRDF